MKTVTTDTLFRAAIRSRTSRAQRPMKEATRTKQKYDIVSRLVRIPRFSRIKITPFDYNILRQVEQHPGEPYASWPLPLSDKRNRRYVERLRITGFLVRSYNPESYCLSVKGFELMHWLAKLDNNAIETKSPTQEAPVAA